VNCGFGDNKVPSSGTRIGAAMSHIASTELIDELEHVIKAGSPERCIQILRQVTCLFLSDAGRFNEHHIGVFDDILVRLMGCVEARTLTRVSAAFAGVASAPKEAVRHLARHADAAVAAPILLTSASLSDQDLIEIAGARGPEHLRAIAGRNALSVALTDALLMRGDTNLCRLLARNSGAQFSSCGFASLVNTAGRDDEIADCLVLRRDMPPELLRDLISKSSPAVQARLLKTAPPEKHEAIRAAIETSASQARAKKPAPVDYSEAKATVLALNNSGKLNDSTVNRFAVRGEHENLVAALSLLATVPIETIELMTEESNRSGLIVACRASRLNWNTTSAVIRNRKDGRPLSPQELERGREVFETLSLSTAQRAIRFGSLREIAAHAGMTGSALVGAG
jgi:uncharacterized protein (DUF2336 family)